MYEVRFLKVVHVEGELLGHIFHLKYYHDKKV